MTEGSPTKVGEAGTCGQWVRAEAAYDRAGGRRAGWFTRLLTYSKRTRAAQSRFSAWPAASARTLPALVTNFTNLHRKSPQHFLQHEYQLPNSKGSPSRILTW